MSARCLSAKFVKTRKRHMCFGCAIYYETGTDMEVCVNVDGGDIHRTYWCKKCSDIFKTLDYWDGDNIDNWGQIRERYWEENT